jgi:RNA polymerase sigma-70 factor (ECF subfamily)
LRAFALSLVPRWVDSEEVLQIANVVMWQKFDQFQPGTNFFSWACRVIHLTSKDYLKRQGREKLRFCDEFLDRVAVETTDRQDELAEREKALSQCIAKLRDKQRQILNLRYQQGQTIDQIANSFGVSDKAIYQSLSRMYKGLSDCVGRQLAKMGFA